MQLNKNNIINLARSQKVKIAKRLQDLMFTKKGTERTVLLTVAFDH